MVDGIVFKSGGTTGNPKFSVFTREEWDTFTRAFGRGMSQGAIQPGDRVGNLFYSGELYASFLFIHDSLMRAAQGAVNFPIAGATAPASVLKTVQDFSIHIIAGVPTTILALAEYMIRSEKTAPWVNRIIFGGEGIYSDQIATLRRAFPNAETHSIGYASVDAGLLGYADSTCAPGEHRAFEETVVEIVSEDSSEPIVETGRPGKLLITNLTRQLMPIVRYPCGDRAQWIEPEGTPNRKFLLLGRSEEGARVGPVSVYYEDVRQIIDRFRDEGSLRAFQIVTERKQGKDVLILRISRPGAGQSIPTGLERRILDSLHDCRPMLAELAAAGKVGPSMIEWVEPQQIEVNPRTGKLKRILDLRK
jgi:phenylacetate-CoA ligase